MEIHLAAVTAYLDEFLRVRSVADYADAHNGLQLENDGRVSRVGAAVDASVAAVESALDRGVDLLLVHHGLFWGGARPVVGNRYRQWRRALAGNLAVYGAHLPLDAHPQVGNAVGLCEALGLGPGQPAFEYKGTAVGRRVDDAGLERGELAERLARALGAGAPVRVCPGGPARVERLAVITGSAGGELREIAAAGVDTLVTGEGPHWTFALAEELGVNVLYGGHYATETFGVKRLAAHLEERWGLPWEFLDLPSGL